MHQRSCLISHVIVGISHLIWLESFEKYIDTLTFHFPCLYSHFSRSQQLKVKTDDIVVDCSIQRYLEPILCSGEKLSRACDVVVLRILVSAGNRSQLPETPPTCLQMDF